MGRPLQPSHKNAATAPAGGEESFADLVVRYKHHVFRLAARFARDSFELEDLCQEVFMRVYERLDSFRREVPFEHWLTRITINVCCDMLRKTKRHRNHVSFEQLPFEPKDAAAESVTEAREAHEILMRALSGLRPKERIVITLVDLEEKSVREAAALTGWSEGNVRVRVHRARQALKKILEEDHE